MATITLFKGEKMKKILMITALACMAWGTQFVGNGNGMGMNSGNGMNRNMNSGNGMGMNSGNGMGKNRMMNMPKFSDFDLNHNGYITKREFEKARNFRMMQNSKQGKMMKNAGNAPSFRSIDTNHDGVITQREFKKHQYDTMWNR
jgi:hypothetical protein